MSIYDERSAGGSSLAADLRGSIARVLDRRRPRGAGPDPRAADRELGMLSYHLLRDIGMEPLSHRSSRATGGADARHGDVRIRVLTGAGSHSARS
jgi:hypothetical protein